MNGAVNLSGYKLTFDAEMTSAADSSQFNNTYINGDRTIPVNNELEYYADNNPASPYDPFSFSNGALNITATPTPEDGLPYTSGLLTTAGIFSQNTGYFEIRAKVPTGSGFWPAFWMLTPDYSTEIDIVEQPNVDGPTNYYTSVKTAGLNTGAFGNVGVDLSSGYHTYGFMWTPYVIQFTFDGQYVGYASPTPSGLATAKAYLLADLAVGGWAATPPAGATAQLSIDYIRAYSNDPTVAAITPEPVSPPDAANLPILPSAGTGPDVLVLQISEDAYQGDAQFTVTVDGFQQGTYTASALKALQQTQALTIYGNFSAGVHYVSVDFLNDAWGGTATTDRNLYVNQATLDGNALSGSTLNLFNAGAQSFRFGTATGFPPTTVLGSGPDVLALQVAEDAYQGDAQFTVSVDGTQVGGVQTATASKAAGSTQAFDILGSFGTGAHTATINFLNDAYGGTSATDRNLYVTQASVDNTPIPRGSLTEYSPGPQSFSFQASAPVNGATISPASASPASPSPASPSPAASAAPNPTLLTLHLAEEAYQGDAQFIVSIDGTQLGGVQSVSALQGQAAQQAFTIADVLTAGTHDVAVSFINDLYGGSSTTDRNLYVVGADLKATALSATAWTASLYSNGAAHFSLVVPA